MSATSRVGRGIRNLFPALLHGLQLRPERVQRALRAGNQRGRNLCVTRSGVDAGVAGQHLNDPRIGTAFQQVSGEAVPQGVAGDAFGEAALFEASRQAFDSEVAVR